MYDTRDNIFSSQTGAYVKLKSMFYRKGTGSSFNFNRYDIDARDFI